jgi:hypothetical protein
VAKQYTKCCDPNDYSGWGGPVAISTIIGAALALITGLWIFLAPTAMVDLVLFCEWWLYRRLVCLGGQQCALGMVVTVEPVEKKGGFERFDTDFSINLLLAPHTIYTQRATIEGDGISGFLIAEQAATRDIGLGFVGYTAKQWQNYPDTPVLHGEFEGGGIYDLLQAAKAVLVVSTIGAVVCSIPVFGWLACLIVFGVAAIIAAVGVIVALNDKGSPSDVNAELTEIHTNDPTGRGADLLVIKGDWVYDSFHDGWNEIHPILQAQRVGTWQGSWGFDAATARDAWCRALEDADSPGTRQDQLKRENQWEVHPVVDGCKPEGQGEPIPIG